MMKRIIHLQAKQTLDQKLSSSLRSPSERKIHKIMTSAWQTEGDVLAYSKGVRIPATSKNLRNEKIFKRENRPKSKLKKKYKTGINLTVNKEKSGSRNYQSFTTGHRSTICL